MTDHTFAPPPPQPQSATPQPPPATPQPPATTDSAPYAEQLAPLQPATLTATRSARGWVVTALVGLLLSAAGAFLTVLKVNGRSVGVDVAGVGVAVPWAYHDRFFALNLFERWDIALALLLGAAVTAVLLLIGPTLRWPAAVGAVLAAVAFHLQLSVLERAEFRALQTIQAPTYAIGGLLMVGGAFLALVSFVVVLLRRQ